MYLVKILTFLIFSTTLEAGSHELFNPLEKKEVARLKSKEFTFDNFKRRLKLQNENRLAFLLKKISMEQKELLDHELKNGPWAALEKAERKFYMNKWISEELNKGIR